MRLIVLLLLALFYAVYIAKMRLQRRNGVQTDQIAKGKKKTRVFNMELILKMTAYSVVAVEIFSILFVSPRLPRIFFMIGTALELIGDILLIVSVITMKDRWHIGIAENDKAKRITNGIYKISRNPVFLAFDCVYIGLLLMFFNWVLLVFSVVAIAMLHFQILQEEQFLANVFGEEYISYKNQVHRYLGRK